MVLVILTTQSYMYYVHYCIGRDDSTNSSFGLQLLAMGSCLFGKHALFQPSTTNHPNPLLSPTRNDKMEALTAILIDTYNQNHDLRVNAEKNLQLFLNTPGSLTVLINTVAANIHNDLRKATALIVKNRLRDYWSTETGALPATLDEKAHFKHQLMVTLLQEHDNSIRGILAESVRIVSEFEFPDK